ncbi:MAG: phosphoglycerate kinase, partial [Bdellovibrionales bacterium]
KKVFLRVDFNVPIKKGKILDTYRIDKTIPTLQYLLDQGAKVVLASHLGRPDGKVDPELSLQPVAQYLTETYNLEVLFLEEPDSDMPHHLFLGLKKNQVILLNNLRFHQGEQGQDKNLAHQWASYIDIYVNEGFSISHRKDTSVYLLPQIIEDRCIGFQFRKEIEVLDQIRFKKSQRPFFVCLGGSKVRDKILILEHLIDQTDEFFIGGMIAFTFLKVKGHLVGDSFVSQEHLLKVEEFINRLEQRNKKLWLPIDHKVIQKGRIKDTKDIDIPNGCKGFDIGTKTQKLFKEQLQRASSIFWNGPMGLFEKEEFSQGTHQVAEALAENEKAYCVIGGGHSALAARKYEDQIDHISTGGGASLCYLKGTPLPGLESILVNTT